MNKRVLITGASSGIGFALTESFLRRGDEVVGIARDFTNTDCIGLQQIELDLSDIKPLPQSLKQESLLEQDFDVLILNAGEGRFGGLEQFSHDQIEALINTNLVSNLFLLKHFLPSFKQQAGKDIVLIGSESALQGAKQGTVYCASKFAIRGLAQSLRAECANADIRVILINPGAVDTDFFADLNFQPQRGDEFAMTAKTVAKAIQDALNLPRNSVVEEINIQPIKRSFKKKPAK
ncbi:MAG: SDR family NAD(P)-dependent oxidoreductase [Acidiferrobacterales bacterium]|nr:SDR family NAD(P)-dependent oxidoreductase [Acidiferrobacterales bacterium]